jgi:hypothetical protein
MESVNISFQGSGIPSQQYSSVDNSLITSNFINANFGAKEDYIELFIYDQNGQILLVDYDAFDYYPYLTANPQNNLYSTLTLDPQKDAANRGFNRGSVNLQYNFFKKLFNSQYGKTYWIKEISNSRTEIKLASQVISDVAIQEGFDVYQNYISTKNYFSDFYLNFGDNILVIGVNVAFAQDEDGAYLLIKLYEPLDSDIDIKSQAWIVDKISEPVSYNVDIQVPSEITDTQNRLRGANYHVRVNQKVAQTTPYYTYNSLLTSNVTSSYQKLLSFYGEKSVDINVNYTNFSNFIHFSSATERLENFKYKLQLIEGYNNDIRSSNLYSGSSSIVASSTATNSQTAINNIIEKFDTYEYYLYFNSGSWTWPKRNNTQPYTLYSVTSSQASNWLGSADSPTTPTTASVLYSASLYDYSNKDYLQYSIPQYLLDDPNNQPYLTFLDMIGQHFDNIWIYYKDVTKRFDATNNPNTGISLDLVSDALKGLGMELYTNTSVSDNLYYSLFGINQDGSLLPPTGSEQITNYVTSSIATLPGQEIQDELYKRLYHNLPYLLKTRGTQRSIKALIACYGIPDSILSVKEFGGVDRQTSAGIYDLDTTNYKITIATGSNGQVTGSTTISSSLLSPDTTLQYYSNNDRLNSTNIEVAFSPSNTVNDYISGSGVITGSIDQYIGNPTYASSESYPALETLRTTYFQSYNKPKSVWEYIRLIKFYNNSLFKTIKDFVPARANVTTGIVIKSHMLERNKYARNEPSMSINQYSQSIEMVTIIGSAANSISGSTAWTSPLLTLVGYVPYSSSQDVEKFTGEFSGSVITPTNYESFPQIEYNNNLSSSAASISNLTSSLIALYQNVTGSIRSRKYFDLDYTSNQNTPINYGIVTQSISASQVPGYDNNAAYNNPNIPYAELQDTNYALQSFTIPRYYGSKTISATYNDYTQGDSSYGSTAAIDKLKYQYGYLVDMYSSSFQLPNRVNAQIKYIIDNQQNVLDLTKANKNIFTVQNVFKSGENTNVSLFNYSPNSNIAQYLTNNQEVNLYEGGFKYTPILHSVDGVTNNKRYFLNTPIVTLSSTTTPTYTTLSPSDQGYWGSFSATADSTTSPGILILDFTATAKVTPNAAYSTYVSVTVTNEDKFYLAPYNTYTLTTYIPAAQTAPYTFNQNLSTDPYNWNSFDYLTVTINSEELYNPAGGTVSSSVYLESVTDLDSRWYALDDRTIRLSATQSAYYNMFIEQNVAAGLETPVSNFVLEQMDLIRLYNTTSGWGSYNESEYRVNEVSFGNSGSVSFVDFTLDRTLNPKETDSNTIPGYISKYIVLKRSPDETNLIFAFSGSSNITDDGLVFPKYIDPIARENSGNVVKALKQQNLI